jgi:hypothetical protein
VTCSRIAMFTSAKVAILVVCLRNGFATVSQH